MSKTGKFATYLTIRLEVYINLVVVPMVLYFTSILRSRSQDEQKFMIYWSLFSTILMIILGTCIRLVLLTGLLKKAEKSGNDITPVKLKILKYPSVEVMIIFFRWFFGLLIPYIALYYRYSLTAQQLYSFIFTVSLAIINNTIISYFTTENCLSKILKQDTLTSVIIPEKSYKEIGIPLRLLLCITTVLIMPIITLGYMLFLVNNGIIRYPDFGYKLSFMMLLSMVTMTVLIYEATNGIRRSMHMTTANLKNLAKGDLDVPYLPMLDRSELGTLTTYVNKLAESLKEYSEKNITLNNRLNILTDDLARQSESLSGNTREQATSIEEIMASTEEISGGADSVMGSIEDQLTSMESLIESMDKLTGVMESVNKSVNSVIKLSGEINSTTQDGTSTLNAMIESLKLVSSSSARMSGITEIINDISDKINLLSLNASIEAARAGDAGKGFAVVADEVSKLADMTAESIKDISILVKGNIDEIQTAMKKIDTTAKSMGSIKSLVNLIINGTDEIALQMKTQNELNSFINNDARIIKEKSEIVKVSLSEQQNALNEITRTVTYISGAVENTVGSAELLSNKAREVDSLAASLVSKDNIKL